MNKAPAAHSVSTRCAVKSRGMDGGVGVDKDAVCGCAGGGWAGLTVDFWSKLAAATHILARCGWGGVLKGG